MLLRSSEIIDIWEQEYVLMEQLESKNPVPPFLPFSYSFFAYISLSKANVSLLSIFYILLSLIHYHNYFNTGING
jgi:hypothetical protein